MERLINTYISRELVSNPELLPLHDDTPLIASKILDSLSILKLVMFLEEQFGIEVDPEDVVPEHFETVDAICGLLRTQYQMQGV